MSGYNDYLTPSRNRFGDEPVDFELIIPEEEMVVTPGEQLAPEARAQIAADEAAALERLRRRIAERDNPPGLAAQLGNPMAGIVDPWAQTQAAAPATAPITAAPSPAAPIPAAPPGFVPGAPLIPGAANLAPPQPAGGPVSALEAAMPGGLPESDAAPVQTPATPTAPTAQPDASTAPQSPTVTAGSQAQGLAAGVVQPQQQAAPNPMAPTNAPQFAMGATGLGGARGGMSERVAAGEAAPNMYDRQLEAARDEDVRRNRWRMALRGLAAIMGMRSLARNGTVSGALPGAIAAGMVRPSDEVATLQGRDQREQALGTEAARQRAMMDQLAQRRAAQEAADRNAQQTLALRMQELQGAQEDRRLRTGIELRENEREEDLLNPESAVSRRERVALESTLAVQPPEIQRAYAGRLGGMSATELRSIRDELRSTGNARTMAGGMGRGSTLGAGGGRIGGMNAAPDSFVMNIRMGSPGMTLEQAQATADERWLMMPARQRAVWENTEQGVAAARALSQNLPGYEQITPGAISPAQYAEAQDIVAGEEAFGVAMNRAITAAQAVEEMPAAEQAGVRLASAVGVDASDEIAEFNDARGAIISALNRMAGGGTMDASEYARWDAMLPTLGSVRGLAPGAATRRLQAAAARARETAEAEMRARGYRRTSGTPPATTTPQDGAQQVTPRQERTVVLTFEAQGHPRYPDGTRRQQRVAPADVERWTRRAPANGWRVVQ